MDQNTSESMQDNVTQDPLAFIKHFEWVYEGARTKPHYQFGHVLELCIGFVLPPLGLLFNSMTIATITRIKPLTSSSLYICSLAVSDTLVLLLKMFAYMIDRFELQVTDYGCAVVMFLGSTILHVSIWTIVVMTFERFVAVIFPLLVNSLFTMKKTKLSILLLYIIFALINGHSIFTFSIKYIPSKYIGYYCAYRPEIRALVRLVWFWVNSVLFAIAPCSLLLVFNIIIILGIKASQKKQKQLVAEAATKKDNQQLQITIMLLTISFSYIIFFVPVCIYMIATREANFFESPEGFAWLYTINQIVYFFSGLNHAVNFFFYVASNRRFRGTLVQLLKCQDISRKSAYKATSMSTSNMRTTTSAISSGRILPTTSEIPSGHDNQM